VPDICDNSISCKVDQSDQVLNFFSVLVQVHNVILNCWYFYHNWSDKHFLYVLCNGIQYNSQNLTEYAMFCFYLLYSTVYDNYDIVLI
jgi:hypothetical protein